MIAVPGLMISRSRKGFESQKPIDKFCAVKGGEIRFLFPGANKPSWDAEFMLNGHSDASFAAPVEFCENHTGEAYGFVKFSGLDEGVGASGGIQNDPFLMRCVWILLTENAGYFG